MSDLIDEHPGSVGCLVTEPVPDERYPADPARVPESLGRLNRALGAAIPVSTSGLATHRPLLRAFEIVEGGGFWGVVRAPSDVMHALRAMDESFPDSRFRVGVGVGASTGEARSHALAALAEAGRKRRWVRVSGLGESADEVLNGMFAAMGALRAGWTWKQARTVRLARRHETRKDVAKELGVSPSVVTEALAAARFGELEEAEGALGRLFALFDPRD